MENAILKYAVIVAGGSGTRMGTEKPKQFLLLKGKPIIWYTIQQFLKSYHDLQVILVLPSEFIGMGIEILPELMDRERVQIITGGSTRFDSVKKGLSVIHKKGIVFVHDGVRCLVSVDLIQRCCKQAIEKGNAIPAVAATDSIRIMEGEMNQVVDRNRVRIIQTPQTFQTELLLPAFQCEFDAAFTDEASVFEAAGGKVFLIDGEYSNIKITRPVDLLLAETILVEKMK
ncbi:MAG: 2-C-methyl-D-erythritol 4-phosphate cytidylyltransferase [Bacteroidota bacterium]